MGEVDLDAAIRARLDADMVASADRGGGGVAAAQTSVEYRRALNALLVELRSWERDWEDRRTPLGFGPADSVRRVVARELGVTQ